MRTHTHIGATEMHGIQSKRIEHQWEFRGPRKLLPHGMVSPMGNGECGECGRGGKPRGKGHVRNACELELIYITTESCLPESLLPPTPLTCPSSSSTSIPRPQHQLQPD